MYNTLSEFLAFHGCEIHVECKVALARMLRPLIEFQFEVEFLQFNSRIKVCAALSFWLQLAAKLFTLEIHSQKFLTVMITFANAAVIKHSFETLFVPTFAFLEF